MPRKKWIDKSTATTYQLVHRPQDDPLIHNESSSSMVLKELAPTQSHKPKTRGDLESELFGASDVGSESGWSVRDNEGEAAEHGIYYDDTDYDYMQHLRDLGSGSGEATWVEAPQADKQKGKEKKIALEDALRQMDLDYTKEKIESQTAKSHLLEPSLLPPQNLRPATYQDQQDVPDTLAGFQPDMDPRLREVLEALEDDAFVDADEEDDFFTAIAQDKREISLAEFEDQQFFEEEEDDDEGWKSDHTAKPTQEYNAPSATTTTTTNPPTTSPPSSQLAPPTSFPEDPTKATAAAPATEDDDHGDGAFMASFRDLNPKPHNKPPASAFGRSSIFTGASSAALTAGGSRRKKRKGAMTNTSSYSMTSSSLFRTEGLTTLDARFEKTLESYTEDGEGFDDDDDGGSVATGAFSTVSGVSGMSRLSGVSGMSGRSAASSAASGSVSSKDFDGIMDEFLGRYSMSGKRRVKKGGYQSGMEQLDEIRKELGRPKVKA